MNITVKNGIPKWSYNDRQIVIEKEGVSQALYSSKDTAVVTLSHFENSPSLISIYKLTGELLFEISEQISKLKFNCLGPNRGHEVAIMVKSCDHSWQDWWYSIDIENKNILPLGEGR